MADPAFGFPRPPFLHRGNFQILVLRTLKDRPMHGYEIMKVLEDRFQGFYKPSPGAVYPALRGLLQRGLVAVDGEEGRKTYRLTAKGKAQLRAHRAELQKHFKAFESAVGPERAALFKEMRESFRALARGMRTITPEQAVALRKIIVEMRGRMMEIIEA